MLTLKELVTQSMLTEMPMVIKPLKNRRNKVQKRLEDIVKNKRYEIVNSPYIDTVILEVDGEILICSEDLRICYFYLSYTKFDLSDHTAQELLIWRDKSNDDIAGAASYIFWKHFFEMNICIVSDEWHTNDGKQFWKRRITEAFLRGLKISIYDKKSKTQERFETLREFNEFNPWGSSSRYENLLIVICKN